MNPDEQQNERLKLAAGETLQLIDLLNELGKLQEFVRLVKELWATFSYEDSPDRVRIELLLTEYLSTAHCLLDEIQQVISNHRETLTGQPQIPSQQFYLFPDT